MVWIEAAKRIGSTYVAIASGTVSSVLAERLHDTAATALISSHAQKQAVHEAVQQLPLSSQQQVRGVASRPLIVLTGSESAEVAAGALEADDSYYAAEVLLERALQEFVLRQTRLMQSSISTPPPPQQPPPPPPPALPVRRLMLPDVDAPRWVAALWGLAAPKPVEASHPLFILYTSGSTGKPKGIVHTHGGYEVGLVATSCAVFNIRADGDDVQRLLVIATPGWITGQSYMIAAALLSASPSVLLEGSPVAPPDRFAEVIARRKVNILKAGSTFLRMVMTGGAPSLPFSFPSPCPCPSVRTGFQRIVP